MYSPNKHHNLNLMFDHIVWPENLTGIKFNEIASKLHNKNMTDFNLTKCPVRRHSIRKIIIDGY